MSDFLLIFIVVILLFGVFRRYILFLFMAGISRLLFRQFQKMQERAMQQQQGFSDAASHSGKSAPPPRKNVPPGEYVDFEEVKD